jgi:hypothetical protein
VLNTPINSPVIVQGIDGRGRGIGFVERYEFLPGPHQLTVVYVQGFDTSVGGLCLEFVALAGRTYALASRQNHSNRTWEAWVLDTETREVASRPCVEGVRS